VRPTRVLVADDDELFRTALVDVVDADPRFEVVGSIDSGADIVDAVRRSGAELVLVDVDMPEGGATAARALQNAVHQGALTRSCVVALSAHASTSTVVDLLRAGAVGYLVKGQQPRDLPELLQRCVGGQVVVAAPTGAAALRLLVGGQTAPVH
jgi:DNA-binding NarL/FixJ family response regulator